MSVLRMIQFKDFPYLYNSTINIEEKSLHEYMKCNDSVALLAKFKKQIVGSIIGVPLIELSDSYKNVFKENNLNINEYFFIGEDVLLPNFRNEEIEFAFLKAQEEHALMHGFKYTVFCAINRMNKHTDRANEFELKKERWKKYNYHQKFNLLITKEWKDIGNQRKSTKKCIFWVKKIEIESNNPINSLKEEFTES